MKINCNFTGCTETFETAEAVSSSAIFLCRYHTGKDTRNTVRFQMHAFDRKLKGKKPTGTGHIVNVAEGAEFLSRFKRRDAETKKAKELRAKIENMEG